MHQESAPQAGQVYEVNVNHHVLGDGPHEYFVEEWWDKLTGGSWMFAEGNPAALMYAIRSAKLNIPLDDEVLYGHLESPGGLGMLIHVSELPEEPLMKYPGGYR